MSTNEGRRVINEKIESNRKNMMNLINIMYENEKSDCVANNQPFQDLGAVEWKDRNLGPDDWNVVYLKYSAEQNDFHFVFQKEKRLYSGGIRFNTKPWTWYVNYTAADLTVPLEVMYFFLHDAQLNFTKRSHSAVGRLLHILQAIYDKKVVTSFVNKGTVYGVVPIELYNKSLIASGYPVFIKDENRPYKFLIDVPQV